MLKQTLYYTVALWPNTTKEVCDYGTAEFLRFSGTYF